MTGATNSVIETIDTHVHVASADVVRYPRQPSGVGSAWWSEPDASAAAVLGQAGASGVGQVVIVQAVGAYGYDSACAADAVAASEGAARFVPALDMRGDDPAARLESHEHGVALSGVRLFGVSDGAPWLDDGRAGAVWRRAAELAITVVPTVFSDRLASLRRVVEANPSVAVALDHCAFPDMAGETGEHALFALADLSPIHLKVSSHVLAAWDAQGRLQLVVDALVDAFGVDRMCWGSDHPQHLGLTYAEKLALAGRATAHLDEHSRRRFFHGTACALGWGA